MDSLKEQILSNSGLLVEEWKDQIKSRTGDAHNIYKNPSMKDFMDLKKSENASEFRYIVNVFGKKEELFMFNANLLHYEAAKHLNIPYKSRVHVPIWGDYGFGSSYLSDGKMMLDSSVKMEIKKMGEKNFNISFLRKFFKNI